MFRFIYVIMMNVFRAPYMIPKMRYMAQHIHIARQLAHWRISKLKNCQQ